VRIIQLLFSQLTHDLTECLAPFGLKALFYNKPFHPLTEVNSLTGELEPLKSYTVLTFSERIRAIWQSVRKSRAQFEAEPDTGFLGKTFVRQLNR
jgi:hypothetical protein